MVNGRAAPLWTVAEAFAIVRIGDMLQNRGDI